METPQPGKIYAAIAAMMDEIKAIGKTSQNQEQNFKYRSIDTVYNVLNPLLSKHKVFTIPEVLDRDEKEFTVGSGKIWRRVSLKVKYTLYCEDGSSISGVVWGEGNDNSDKASNKALAAAHKYFLLQTFSIPTEDLDDPDRNTVEQNSRSKSTSTKSTAPKPPAAAKPGLPAPGGANVAPPAATKTQPIDPTPVDEAEVCACGDASAEHAHGIGPCAGKDGKCNCNAFTYPADLGADPGVDAASADIRAKWAAAKNPKELFAHHFDNLAPELKTEENRKAFWAKYHEIKPKKGAASAATK